MNAQKKLPNASFEEKCWLECRWPLAHTAPSAWRRLPATTEGGGKTPAGQGRTKPPQTEPPPLKTVTWIRDSPLSLLFFFFFFIFIWLVFFTGNCCGCDPCPGMRSWTLLKGFNKGTSVLELFREPCNGRLDRAGTFQDQWQSQRRWPVWSHGEWMSSTVDTVLWN